MSLWWSKGKSSDLCWRTSQSGGRATTRAKSGKRTAGHCGDLCATDESMVPFFKSVTVELKRGYNRATIHDILDRPDGGDYFKFIVQARKAAERAETPWWMLIHKRDRRTTLVVIPEGLDRKLADCPVLCGLYGTGAVICLFDNFLEDVDPREFL